MPFEATPFLEIAAVLFMATILGIVGQGLRQPLLIMFLATGILAGPAFLGIIRSYEQIELLAQVGIALLLFIVGLKLDLKLIRTTGPVAFATGVGQILFTSAIGFAIATGLGMAPMHAAYVALALTFSSTIIIVKLLSDKREIDSLHGQIAIGFLIVQDIAAILALVALTTIGAQVSEGGSLLLASLVTLGKGLGLLAVVALLMNYFLPWLTRRLAYSQELLTLFAISWAVFLGAGSEVLGFTKEVGAFLAGVSLASTGYRDAIGARLTTLRDFLLLFFFIDLGARLDWSSVGTQLWAAGLFSLFVLLGKPLIMLIIMGVMGYRRRTSFLAGLTVAQISEFSLIIAALGLSLGHIDPETMGLITLVGVVTILASTYMILYSGQLYGLLSNALRIFERRNPFREAAIDTLQVVPDVDVIVVGLGNYGSALAEYLLRRGKTIIGVDFDPEALDRWRTRGVPVIYGDIGDPELHEQLPISHARWIVSTVRSRDLNLALLQHLRELDFGGRVALTATTAEEGRAFEQAGVRVVFRPFTDAAEQAADALTSAMDLLPTRTDLPIHFREVRLRSDSQHAGRAVSEIPVRDETGVTILAISRAGQVHYDPPPDLVLHPGDRVVIVGEHSQLDLAEVLLNEAHDQTENAADHEFKLAELVVEPGSTAVGQSLADLHFRKRHGVNVIAIRRGDETFNTSVHTVPLAVRDVLVVIGSAKRVDSLLEANPL